MGRLGRSRGGGPNMRHFMILLLIAVLAVPRLVFASLTSIGVFFTPDASDCDYVARTLEPFTTYVLAVLGTDAAADGITGVEFRLIGIDPSWLDTVTPSPLASIVLGDPIGIGAGIVFPA